MKAELTSKWLDHSVVCAHIIQCDCDIVRDHQAISSVAFPGFPSRPELLHLLKVLPLLFLHFFIGHDFGQNVPVHFAGRNWSRRKKPPPVNRSLSSDVSEKYCFILSRGLRHAGTRKMHTKQPCNVKAEALNPLRGVGFCCLARPCENKGQCGQQKGAWWNFAKLPHLFGSF